MRIELSAEAERNLEVAVADRGMIKMTAMSRLVHWFSVQPIETQALMLVPQSSETDVLLKKLVLQNFIAKAR